MNLKAEEMYLQALRGYEKAWAAEHSSTLNTVNNLGILYKNQGKMAEAEDMLLQALRGYEEVVEKDHPTTRTITRNLQAVQARK